jgi:hypothetical protein
VSDLIFSDSALLCIEKPENVSSVPTVCPSYLLGLSFGVSPWFLALPTQLIGNNIIHDLTPMPLDNGVGWNQTKCPMYEFFKKENALELRGGKGSGLEIVNS